jgi:hypothetical protein
MNTKIDGSSSRFSSKNTRHQAPEPPLPPIVAELRPWAAVKFTAGFCDVSGRCVLADLVGRLSGAPSWLCFSL